MWYPNKAQWRVIRWMAAIVTLLALAMAVNGEPGFLVLMFWVDGALLVWKLQKTGEPK